MRVMGFRGPECTTCRRPDVGDIHRLLDEGGSIRGVAAKFGIGESTLRLHMKHRAPVHAATPPTAPATAARPKVPPAPPSPLAGRQRPPDSGALPLDDLEGRLRQLARTADKLREEVEDADLSPRDRGQILGQARATVESMAKIHMALSEGREEKLVAAPEWAALRERIVEILAPWPEARVALEDGLREEAA